ncbi:acid protease [Dichomitus squalens]|uniref:Acid protease n=1 Tax=Dichomitus squalens TaxID=114155 RepID=A0A4V2K7C8_9APHY|nr:acid protease [Dichomitus squalens]
MMNLDEVGLANSGNVIYLVNVTLGGEDFTVQLDTGSTDLWVDARGRNVKLTNSTTITANETYGQGSASGTINYAELTVGDYVVASQAFVKASEVENMPAGIQGILGMAFDNARIFENLEQAWGTEAAEKLGRAFITNLFARNQSLPNNFDLQLGRSTFDDPTGNNTFIISGHAAGFEDVAQAPKLTREVSDHWTVLLDEMRVDGKQFLFNKSVVSGVPEGNVLAVLDSGFSLPPLPAAAVNAIYSTVPGAVLHSSPIGALNGWILPCDFPPIDVSFTFGGKEYPVHPLDLFLPVFPVPIIENGSEKNVTVCVATYQALALDPASFNTFDLILGDAFLRSVYASFDYGDYNPTNNTNGQPFVQMVSTVDVYSAPNEFEDFLSELRSNAPPSLEPSVFVTKQLSPSLTGGTNASTDSSVRGSLATDAVATSSGSSNGLDKKWGTIALALLAANLLVGIILLIVVLTMCVRGMKGRRMSNPDSRYHAVPVKFKEVADPDPEAGPLRYSD